MGKDEEEAEGYCVRQTTDGGYIATGISGDLGFNQIPVGDVYLVRTDSSGNLVWQKSFGGVGGFDAGHCVVQAADGGFYVCGQDETVPQTIRSYLLKTDANGTLAWEKTFGDGLDDAFYSLDKTSDGGLILSGNLRNFIGDNVYLVKTDSGGNLQWEKRFSKFQPIKGFSIQQTRDGGYILGGGFDREPFRYAGALFIGSYILKTDTNGNMEWELDPVLTGLEGIVTIRQTDDDGYIACGFTMSELLLLKYEGSLQPLLDASSWTSYR